MQRHRARALCDHRRPCWQRSGRSCMAPPEPLPLGPAAAANAPLPGASGRALCAATTAVLTYTTSELFVRLGTALAAAGGGAKAPWVLQWPAGLQEDVRHTGASASARLAPWKGHRRCTFPRRHPRAICGHPGQVLRSQGHWTPLLVAPRFALSAHSEPLRSRLDPLDRE